jgi:hypothetical protein
MLGTASTLNSERRFIRVRICSNSSTRDLATFDLQADYSDMKIATTVGPTLVTTRRPTYELIAAVESTFDTDYATASAQ